jgi:hypothetical protein
MPSDGKSSHCLRQGELKISTHIYTIMKCNLLLRSSKNFETKLHRNDHWKVLYKVCVFYADRKSKMAATTGHSNNTGPYGENTKIIGHENRVGQME